jgi:hypothetical protein
MSALLTEEIESSSNDDMNENILIIKRKIEKYIISFNLQKQIAITSDLNKLLGYCDTLKQYSRESLWIIK